MLQQLYGIVGTARGPEPAVRRADPPVFVLPPGAEGEPPVPIVPTTARAVGRAGHGREREHIATREARSAGEELATTVQRPNDPLAERPECLRSEWLRSVPTATAKRQQLIAKRAVFQSELQDLNNDLRELILDHQDELGAAASCSEEAEAIKAEIITARNKINKVNMQVAALDEWIAKEKSQALIKPKLCVDCPGCQKLKEKVAKLEEEAEARRKYEDDVMASFSESLRRCERDVKSKGQELAEAQELMRKKVGEAEEAREKWTAEKKKRIAVAEDAKLVVVGELPALREKVEKAAAQLQGLEDEIFSLRNEYRLVGELSLKVLKTVEEDRKQVQKAVEPWQREEGTMAMRHANSRLDMVEASKAEVDAKLERTEKRLAVAEEAQAHNLEPKINVLEHKVHKVQKHEEELHEIIKVNTERLNQIDVQCKKVNNWMMALAGGGPSDVFDEVQTDDAKKETGGETGEPQKKR